MVINGVPEDVGEEEVLACCSKVGEVLRVKADKRRGDVFWVTFNDKKAARVASKRGLGFGAVKCKVVRVRPDFLLQDPQQEHRESATRAGEINKRAEDRGAKEKAASKSKASAHHQPRRTAIVLNLPQGVTQVLRLWRRPMRHMLTFPR